MAVSGRKYDGSAPVCAVRKQATAARTCQPHETHKRQSLRERKRERERERERVCVCQCCARVWPLAFSCCAQHELQFMMHKAAGPSTDAACCSTWLRPTQEHDDGLCIISRSSYVSFRLRQ